MMNTSHARQMQWLKKDRPRASLLSCLLLSSPRVSSLLLCSPLLSIPLRVGCVRCLVDWSVSCLFVGWLRMATISVIIWPDVFLFDGPYACDVHLELGHGLVCLVIFFKQARANRTRHYQSEASHTPNLKPTSAQQQPATTNQRQPANGPIANQIRLRRFVGSLVFAIG